MAGGFKIRSDALRDIWVDGKGVAPATLLTMRKLSNPGVLMKVLHRKCGDFRAAEADTRQTFEGVEGRDGKTATPVFEVKKETPTKCQIQCMCPTFVLNGGRDRFE